MKFLPTIHEPVYPPADTPKTGRGYVWTARELQVIRERYLSEGLDACLKLLPVRNAQGLMNQAAKMGLKRQKPHAQPTVSNELLDAAIRRLYAGEMGSGQLRDFCARHDVTRQWVQRRALLLGIARPMMAHNRHPRAWSAAELEILERHAGKAPEMIARHLKKAGFTRTPTACRERRWIMGFDSSNPDIYTANDLGRLMGIDQHSVVRWITAHGLPATKCTEGPYGVWQIKRKDLRAWLIRSAVWDHRRVNREFLIEILAGRVGVQASNAEAAA
jgi:hypothetical protein